jgi:isovaleryl-CoA dehydrogenase
VSNASAPVEFDFGLPDELTLLREQIRRFAAERIAPRAADIDRDNRFPRDLWPDLGALGLLGVTVDPALGGAGLGLLAHVVAMEEISRASASVGLSYAAHSNLCVNQLAVWGTDEQKRRFLPDLLSGRHVGALAISEPQAGSDVLGMRTTAVPDGEGFRLDGRKMWITNGPEADVAIVYARVADGAGGRAASAHAGADAGADADADADEGARADAGARAGAEGRPAAVRSGETRAAPIKAFVVEKSLPGFSTEPKLDKLGMRGSDTCALVLERCEVPASHVLPGDGLKILMSGLDSERVVLAGGPLGIMLACLDAALPYVHERKQFGQPIGSFELMQGKLADMYAATNSSRAYVYAVASAFDRGRRMRRDAAAAIMKASEAATWVAGQTIQTLGGNGYTSEYPAGRLWRDAKLYEIGAGTNEIRRMLIGRELFAATDGAR